MTSQSMIVVCALDAGCYTRDGTLQPKGMAFDRVVTLPDGSDYAPGPGLALVPDDGRALYVQNSGGRPYSPKLKPFYPNDAMALKDGMQVGQEYRNTSGIQEIQPPPSAS